MNPFFAAAQPLQLDHLVVIAATLEAGAQHVADALGVEPVAGGRHTAMGTHNQLLNLWGGQYLEIIALDPQAAAPARPRWFGLDQPALQARLAAGPFLAHWVARVERPKSLVRWQAQYPQRIAPVLPMARGAFTWQISVPADGALPGQGVLPTLIQWDTPAHPSAQLPEPQVALRTLRGLHTDVATLEAELDWLGARHLITLDVEPAEPGLIAEFDTPLGIRILK